MSYTITHENGQLPTKVPTATPGSFIIGPTGLNTGGKGVLIRPTRIEHLDADGGILETFPFVTATPVDDEQENYILWDEDEESEPGQSYSTFAQQPDINIMPNVAVVNTSDYTHSKFDGTGFHRVSSGVSHGIKNVDFETLILRPRLRYWVVRNADTREQGVQDAAEVAQWRIVYAVDTVDADGTAKPLHSGDRKVKYRENGSELYIDGVFKLKYHAPGGDAVIAHSLETNEPYEIWISRTLADQPSMDYGVDGVQLGRQYSAIGLGYLEICTSAECGRISPNPILVPLLISIGLGVIGAIALFVWSIKDKKSKSIEDSFVDVHRPQ